VGTGSGCLLTAILAGCPKATGVAFDLSAEALAIARRNAAQNGVASRARFARGSLLESAGAERFDLIVSNPPYIPTADLAALQPEVRDCEPRMALDGGADGLECLRQLAAAAPRALKPGGWLAVEVGQGQAAPVADLLRARGLRAVGTRRDLAGIERIVYGQWLVARNQRSENVSS
jgi:release factor glutamine methyltransferase